MKDHAHVAASPASELVFAQSVHRLAHDDHFSAGGAVNPGDHVDECGFAAAGGADHTYRFTGLDFQRYFAQHSHVAHAVVERLDDLVEMDD